MQDLDEVLRFLEVIVFPGLAVAAFLQWRRRGGDAAAWLVGTFSVLAVVVIVGRFLPEKSDSAAIAVIRMFQKFARADKKRSKANQGTGLGLSIARGLARASGGDAWYERTRPKGSCFGVRLPRAVP